MPSACRHCKKPNVDGRTHCAICGLPLVLPTPCKACGRDVPAGTLACPYCGMPVERPVPARVRDGLCTSCGKLNPGSRIVCLYCGGALGQATKCKTCGRDMPADGSACRYCGPAIAATRPPPALVPIPSKNEPEPAIALSKPPLTAYLHPPLVVATAVAVWVALSLSLWAVLPAFILLVVDLFVWIPDEDKIAAACVKSKPLRLANGIATIGFGVICSLGIVVAVLPAVGMLPTGGGLSRWLGRAGAGFYAMIVLLTIVLVLAFGGILSGLQLLIKPEGLAARKKRSWAELDIFGWRKRD